MEFPNYPEIEKLIESGEALPYLQEFIKHSVTLSVGVRSGTIQYVPGMEAAIVAGVVLQKLMDTADGRGLLGIRASNKKKEYNVKGEPVTSPKMDVARRLIQNELTREQALAELRDLFAADDLYPEPSTLKRYLSDVEEEAYSMMRQLDHLMRSTGWDGESQDDLRAALNSIVKGRPKGA